MTISPISSTTVPTPDEVGDTEAPTSLLIGSSIRRPDDSLEFEQPGGGLLGEMIPGDREGSRTDDLPKPPPTGGSPNPTPQELIDPLLQDPKPLNEVARDLVG